MSPMSECVLAIGAAICRARARKDQPVFEPSRVIPANGPARARSRWRALTSTRFARSAPPANQRLGVKALHRQQSAPQVLGVDFCLTSYAPALGKNGAIFS